VEVRTRCAEEPRVPFSTGLARLQERALFRATFTGAITRVERTPTPDGFLLAVFYREYTRGISPHKS
jgi:hypothetical protein